MGSKIEKEKVIGLLKPITITTATTSTAVAVNLFEDDCVAVLQLGTIVDAHVTVTIEATAGTSGGSYTTVGTFTETIASGIGAVAVDLAGQTFARAKIAMTGTATTTVVPISVSLFGSLSHEANDLNSATVA